MRTTIGSRKTALAGFAVGLAVVVMAGTAFACTVTLGKITISAVNGTANSGSATYQGDGTDPTVPHGGFCDGMPTSRVALETDDANGDVLQFKLDVERPSCNNVGSGLNPGPAPAGTYEVHWVKAEETIDWSRQCGGDRQLDDELLVPRVKLGTIDVAASGTTSKTFNLGGSQAIPLLPQPEVGPGNICVDYVQDPNLNVSLPHIFMKWNVV